ncbi:MAG: glycosyltransferase [Candidatus Hodarchaeales archaeon]
MEQVITTRNRNIKHILEQKEQQQRENVQKTRKIITQMITTRDTAVNRIVEKKSKQDEYRRIWAELRKKKFGAIPGYFPYTQEVNRHFSEVLEDGAWKGHRCFIIGGGESLKGFDFSKLNGELIIGVNRAYEKVDCSIMFAMDYEFYKWIVRGKLGQKAKEKFDNFKGYKVWVDSAKYSYLKDIFLLNCIGTDGFSWSLKDGLASGCNSGYAALNLAVCLGANPIYLLGFDMRGGHWHTEYPDKQPESVYKKFKIYFEKIAPELKQKGIKVINLNPNSTLRCFEFGKFEDIRRETITAITPTGDRPLAFALCQQWMRHQTRQPDQWIVVDDGKKPMKPSMLMQYVRREPQPSDPKHTLILNLKKAMPLINGDKIMIIEDDEYYAPEYIAKMALGLDRYEVVGIGKSKYYHLPSGGYFKIGNTTHASLAETGFRSSFLPEFKALLDRNNVYLDFDLWKKISKKGRGFIFLDDDRNPLYVGMKGLPGRTGIGRGHDPTFYKKYPQDKDRAVLKKWIPKDYNIYMDVLNKKLTDNNYQLYFPDITGITVCYNTKDLIERAYNSVRKFHPYMPIIIIDGSDPKDPCASYIKSLSSNLTTVISLGYNIGHGKGMVMGINNAKTKYALIFDSDIEMLKSPVQAMLEMMEEDTFGVGFIQKVGMDGYDYGVKPEHKGQEWMLYLHPYFQLINIENYRKFHPYVHHGAPCYLTMRDIYKRGLSNKILKEFPGLGHSASQGYGWKGKPKEYIRHDTRGTRIVRKKKNLNEIEQGWVYK